jgi:Uma2 family endonuclease
LWYTALNEVAMSNAARSVSSWVPRCTAAEYLIFENNGALKHEFTNGLVYVMAGATRRHNLIAGDLHTPLNMHLLPERCQAYVLDTKVHVLTDDEEHYFYPDVFVTCSALDTDAYSSTLPVLVVEVASPSTADFDRGEKFRAYRLLPSLLEYGILSQDERRLELFRKRTDWAPEVFHDGEDVMFESVGLRLPLASLYRRVSF